MSKPTLIKDWTELAKVPESDTHYLEIHEYNGWIHKKQQTKSEKESHEDLEYLSTHTFYGLEYQRSTKRLQACGFNVQLANWDEVQGINAMSNTEAAKRGGE